MKIQLERSTWRKGVSTSAFLLAGLCLLAVGAAIAITVLPAPEAKSTPEAVHQKTFQPLKEKFADERDVELVVVRAPSPTLLAAADGVITNFSCYPRYSLRSGTTPLAIDGDPKIALATDVPPWRNFAPGMKGRDVEALQRELTRLGYLPRSPTSRYDLATRKAVAELFEQASGHRPTARSLMLTSFLWLPSTDAVVEKCDASVGSRVSAGAPIASVRASVHAVEIKAPLPNVVPGKRELILGDQTYEIDQSGAITNSALLTRLTSDNRFQAFEESNGQSGLRAKYRLSEAIDVYSVPPSSVLFGATESVCVVGEDGRSVPVSVVSSTLGRSLIRTKPGLVLPGLQLEPASETACA